MSDKKDGEATPITFEALKVGMRQGKDGVNITLTLHPDDVSAELLGHPIGSRYMVVLVKVDDEEKQATSPSATEQAQKSLTASAGIVCRDKRFWRWIGAVDEADAIEKLYAKLGIRSRIELRTDPEARAKFFELRKAFEEWRTWP